MKLCGDCGIKTSNQQETEEEDKGPPYLYIRTLLGVLFNHGTSK